ncbi:acyl-CoA thioesterase, partial [candidate division WOR-3 bacterium]
GNIVRLKAKLTWVGRTSMEVKLEVLSEDFETQRIELTNQAYFVYVALDQNGRPKPVPGLILETDEERKEFEDGKKRRDLRLRSRGNR